MFFLLVSLYVASSSPADPAVKAEFLALVDQIDDQIEHMNFDYEVKGIEILSSGLFGEKIVEKPIYTVTGKWKSVSSKFLHVDNLRNDLKLAKEFRSILVLNKDRYSIFWDSPERRQIVISNRSYIDYEMPSSPQVLFPLKRMRQFLKSIDCKVKKLDEDFIESHACKIYEVSSHNDALVERFWIDEDRKMVAKYEQSFPNGIIRRYKNYTFQKFSLKRGGSVFFPTTVRAEYFSSIDPKTKKRKTDYPDYYEVVAVPIETIDLDSPIAEDQFDVKFRQGDDIDDKIQRKHYEYGQDLRDPAKTAAERKARLEEYLVKARNPNVKIEAQAWSRRVVDWGTIIPLIFAGVFASCLVFLWYKKNRS